MPTKGVARIPSIPVIMKMLYIYTSWEEVDWALAQTKTFEWQTRIYSASKSGDLKTVRKYQHRVIRSMDAKLLAVRRVTQDNQSKRMTGIDKVKFVPPTERIALAKSLVISGSASPLRRVSILKPRKTEKTSLGVPTIKDQCLQVLFKLALEPEWEAKFENNSYGFRPGRNCHDAIVAIRCFIQKRAKYVLNAEMVRCFKSINHEKLLNKIGMKGKYRKQLKSWLKFGVLDFDAFLDIKREIPQGGVIAPLLANIALHGIEDFCKELIKDIPVYGSTGKLIKPGRRGESLGFVRYADNFVIIHPDLTVILLLHKKVTEFLGQMGLELNTAKTRITHTLEVSETAKQICPGLIKGPGFNFLGFFIRQHKTKHLSARGSNKQLLGFRTLIIPSKEKRNAHQVELHNLILRRGKSMKQEVLIRKLRAVIRRWANYFGKSDANTMGLLGQMDYLLYLKLRKWAKRVYKTTSKGTAAFRRVDNNKWTFANHKEALTFKHIDYSQPLSGYVKVKGDASPFDNNQIYWANRLIINNVYNERVTFLLKRQNGNCNWCKAQFRYDDILEVDHIIQKKRDGEDDIENLQLLHRHCHDIKTSLDKLF